MTVTGSRIKNSINEVIQLKGRNERLPAPNLKRGSDVASPET
jgi:hypothetical protein